MSPITLFSQIISKLDREKFSKLVKDTQSDKACKDFNSWSHLVLLSKQAQALGTVQGLLLFAPVKLRTACKV
jgi:Domain of unknown function (DUF4372)